VAGRVPEVNRFAVELYLAYWPKRPDPAQGPNGRRAHVSGWVRLLTPVPRRVLARFEGLTLIEADRVPRPSAVRIAGEQVEPRPLTSYAEVLA